MDTLDRIIVNGVEQDAGPGEAMTEPWNSERTRRERTKEAYAETPPADPPFPIPKPPAIENELPPLPEEDGEYTLVLTIESGVAAMTWESTASAEADDGTT